MIKVISYENLGHANHGWLDARHHFSFGSYRDASRVHFGALRVVNDDRVAAGKGFPEHPHDNMEIVTYVRQGAVAHRDSLGHEGLTQAGDVQVMSAGEGIEHSEMNPSAETLRLYQIWIIPAQANVPPRWEQRQFPKDFSDKLTLLVSGQPEHKDAGAIFIHQDAAIYGGRIQAGQKVTQAIKHMAYVLVSKGKVEIDSQKMKEGDGAEITGAKKFTIKAIEDAEVLVIDVPELK